MNHNSWERFILQALCLLIYAMTWVYLFGQVTTISPTLATSLAGLGTLSSAVCVLGLPFWGTRKAARLRLISLGRGITSMLNVLTQLILAIQFLAVVPFAAYEAYYVLMGLSLAIWGVDAVYEPEYPAKEPGTLKKQGKDSLS